MVKITVKVSNENGVVIYEQEFDEGAVLKMPEKVWKCRRHGETVLLHPGANQLVTVSRTELPDRKKGKKKNANLQAVPETPEKHRPSGCGVSNRALECMGCSQKLGLIIPGHCYYLEGTAALKR